jgi:hypothetical protein
MVVSAYFWNGSGWIESIHGGGRSISATRLRILLKK